MVALLTALRARVAILAHWAEPRPEGAQSDGITVADRDSCRADKSRSLCY